MALASASCVACRADSPALDAPERTALLDEVAGLVGGGAWRHARADTDLRVRELRPGIAVHQCGGWSRGTGRSPPRDRDGMGQGARHLVDACHRGPAPERLHPRRALQRGPPRLMGTAGDAPAPGSRANYLEALGIDIWVRREAPAPDDIPDDMEAPEATVAPGTVTAAVSAPRSHASVPGAGETGQADATDETSPVVEEAVSFVVRGFRLGQVLALIDEPWWGTPPFLSRCCERHERLGFRRAGRVAFRVASVAGLGLRRRGGRPCLSRVCRSAVRRGRADPCGRGARGGAPGLALRGSLPLPGAHGLRQRCLRWRRVRRGGKSESCGKRIVRAS